MSRPIPGDTITDVRVRVPHGYLIHRVEAISNDRWRAANLSILAVIKTNPETPAATFEIGKTYRTRGGDIAGPLKVNAGALIYTLRGCALGSESTWTADGRNVANIPSRLDLMPGAIEDDPAAQAEMAIAGLDVLVLADRAEIASRRMDNHNTRLRNLQDRICVLERSNSQAARAGAIQGTATAIEADQNRCTTATEAAREAPYSRAEAIKKVRAAMTTVNTVVGVVGRSNDGGWGDDWALGLVLQLEALGLIGGRP